MKTCKRCGEAKLESEFYKEAKRKDGLAYWCKECKDFWSADRRRGYYMKKRGCAYTNNYGEILNKQDGRCAICGANQAVSKRAFNMDHNHKTGKVRGVLCASCNNGLGLFKDDPVLLLKAAEYLESFMIDDEV